MSADEVRAIVAQVVGNGVPLQGPVYLILVLVSLLASGIGAWFGSFLSEKGKNYATRQDLDNIIEQLRRTTKITEEIKAQISGDLWVKQRRRELQLEVLNKVNEFLSKMQVAVVLGEDSVLWKVPMVEQAMALRMMVNALFTESTFQAYHETYELIRKREDKATHPRLIESCHQVIRALVEEVCKP